MNIFSDWKIFDLYEYKRYLVQEVRVSGDNTNGDSPLLRLAPHLKLPAQLDDLSKCPISSTGEEEKEVNKYQIIHK